MHGATIKIVLGIFPMGQQPLVGQGPFMIEDSRSHSDTPNSVRILWKSDQPDAELYPIIYNIYKRQTFMLPVGFEPTIPASKRQQTIALNSAATGVGIITHLDRQIKSRK